MSTKPLEINSKEIQLLKSITSADYSGKTVLTNSSWEFVELWFKRQSSKKQQMLYFIGPKLKTFILLLKLCPLNLDLLPLIIVA